MTMDDMTPEEKEIVDELRKRTINDATPKMLEDVSLFYRFAKAREFNLTEAESMLRKHIAWRKEVQVDTITTDYEPPEVLEKYIPVTIIGFDNEKGLVRFLDCGRTDAKGLWNVVKKPELVKFTVYHMEKDKELLIKNGRNLGKPVYSSIYDFEGLTYANTVSIKTFQNLVHLLKMFMDNYPEVIRRISIINAPSYFAWLYSAIKPIVPKQILDKVRVYGTDGWKEEIQECIDADTLPAYLGGTRTDPDGNPLCLTFIPRGQPIPESYYTKKESKKSTLAFDGLKLTLQPLSKERISIEVKEENACIEWEIELNNRDVDFSLHFNGRTEDFEPIEIVPKLRIDANDETEKGFYKCEKTGKYTIVFDNTYSWFYSKELYYRVEIKSLKDDEINGLA